MVSSLFNWFAPAVRRLGDRINFPDRSLNRVRFIFLLLGFASVALAELRLGLGVSLETEDPPSVLQRGLTGAALLCLPYFWLRFYRTNKPSLLIDLAAGAVLLAYALAVSPPIALGLTFVFVFNHCLYGDWHTVARAFMIAVAVFGMGMVIWYDAGIALLDEFFFFQIVAFAMMAGVIGLLRKTLADHEALTDRMIEQSKMEAIGRLAGGVAHDFNNLLTGIRGSLELALLEVDDDQVREDLSVARNGADRAAALTQQLLTFARKDRTRPVVVDTNHQLREARSLLDRIGKGMSMEVQFEPCEEELPVRIDPAQLDRVLVNLMMNASEAIEDGGRVWVRTRMTPPAAYDPSAAMNDGSCWAVIEVEDTGTGMDEETLLRATEPYFSTREEGTGIGLAVVHGVVSDVGGSLEIDSEPGQGTQVRIALPIAEKSEAGPPPGDSLGA